MIPGPPARGCEIWYWDMTIEDMGTCFLYSRAPAQRWGLVMHLPGAQLGVQSKNGSPQVLARTWVPNPEGLWVFANAFFFLRLRTLVVYLLCYGLPGKHGKHVACCGACLEKKVKTGSAKPPFELSCTQPSPVSVPSLPAHPPWGTGLFSGP